MVEISYDSFGSTADGTPVTRWHLESDELSLAVLDRGATVQSLQAPDQDGRVADVVLGFDDVAGYETAHRMFAGAVVGRFANRIARGAFTLDGVEHRVARNDGVNTLHGGPDGFDKRRWSVEPVAGGVRCSIVSPDDDQGFPGTLHASVTYRIVGATVEIRYRASTDAPTVVNLTQHAYFALDGVRAGTAGQLLQLNADAYTPVDDEAIPLGPVAPVAGTRFDLRAPTRVRDIPGGLDHNFVLAADPASRSLGLRPVGSITAPGSGRRLEVFSTEPGVQVFTATGLDQGWIGKGGVPIQPGAGIALETQHFPDAPNRPEYPSTRLDPGQVLESLTEWRFSR